MQLSHPYPCKRGLFVFSPGPIKVITTRIYRRTNSTSDGMYWVETGPTSAFRLLQSCVWQAVTQTYYCTLARKFDCYHAYNMIKFRFVFEISYLPVEPELAMALCFSVLFLGPVATNKLSTWAVHSIKLPEMWKAVSWVKRWASCASSRYSSLRSPFCVYQVLSMATNVVGNGFVWCK